MKVKLLASFGSDAKVFNRGEEYECSADEAQRLIDRGYAELIREQKIERAVKRGKSEKAAK